MCSVIVFSVQIVYNKMHAAAMSFARINAGAMGAHYVRHNYFIFIFRPMHHILRVAHIFL